MELGIVNLMEKKSIKINETEKIYYEQIDAILGFKMASICSATKMNGSSCLFRKTILEISRV